MSSQLKTMIVILLLLASPLLHAQPCPVTLGPTLQISNTAIPAFSPKLAVVGDTVHVVYHAGAVYYQRSTDGGQAWGVQTEMVAAESMSATLWNRPLAAMGRDVILVWSNRNSSGAITSIKIRRSTDAGMSWLEPQVIVANQSSVTYDAPMVTAFDTQVFVTLNRAVFPIYHYFLTRSFDGGITWDSVRQITTVQETHGALGDLRATMGGVYLTLERATLPSGREIGFMLSTDAGITWGAEQVLSTIDDYQAWEPNVAADDAGNVYVSWQDAKYGSIGGFAGTVLLRRSTDHGQTWLPEVQVSSLPSARGSSLSVDGGSVHAVWDDERNGFQDGTIQYRGSSDEGITWCSEMTLGGPLRRALNAAFTSISQHLYAVWSSDRSVAGDTAQVFFQGGDIITNVEQTHSTVHESFIVSPPYPNPFNSITTLEYRILSHGPVAISVFDNLGRTIANVFEGSQAAGRYRMIFDGSMLASGVYHVVARHQNTQIVREVILIR